MIVNPFWFGIGIGIFGTVVTEFIFLIIWSLKSGSKKKNGKE